MGTRCNVLIESGQSRIYLYRHWDGYLAETGADLADKLVAAKSYCQGADNAFLHSLMAVRDEATAYRAAKPVYELTTDVHGDIEYFYKVVFPRHGEPRIGYQMRRPVDEAITPDLMRSRCGATEISVFVGFVNAAIRERNARLVQLQRDEANGPWKDQPAQAELVCS